MLQLRKKIFNIVVLNQSNNFVMKKLLATSLLLIVVHCGFSQGQSDNSNGQGATNRFPPNGNAGVGTTSPVEALEIMGNELIHGNATIDKNLEIKENTLIRKELNVKERTLLEGMIDARERAEFMKEVHAKDRLILDGEFLGKEMGTFQKRLHVGEDIIGGGGIIIDKEILGKENGIIQKELHVGEKIHGGGGVSITGPSDFNGPMNVFDQAQISGNLRVLGDITTEGNLRIAKGSEVELDFKAKGNSEFLGDVVMYKSFKAEWLADPIAAVDKCLLVDKFGSIKSKKCDDPFPTTCLYNQTGLPNWQYGTDKIYVDCPENVKVGIGTKTPLTTLHLKADRPDITLDMNSTSSFENSQIVYSLEGSAIAKLYASKTNRAFYIQTNGYDALTINQNGNVGIGYTNLANDYKLAVNGKVRARLVEVTLDNWSDFVFDEDYKLTPIEEVGLFIEREHHLPGIPSEADVLNKGIDLGKMDAALLMKIEELTLYLIEQNEKIKNLELELSKLK